jgi:O-acetyl-ADP-ribose deacetylase (regulator of RNase III)
VFKTFLVDGAIHKAAGSLLLEECRTIKGGCPTGQAKITGGYKLPAKCIIFHISLISKENFQRCTNFFFFYDSDIIHTVGPINPTGTSPTPELAEKLTNCYLNSLNLAASNGLKTIVRISIHLSIFPSD